MILCNFRELGKGWSVLWDITQRKRLPCRRISRTHKVHQCLINRFFLTCLCHHSEIVGDILATNRMYNSLIIYEPRTKPDERSHLITDSNHRQRAASQMLPPGTLPAEIHKEIGASLRM